MDTIQYRKTKIKIILTSLIYVVCSCKSQQIITKKDDVELSSKAIVSSVKDSVKCRDYYEVINYPLLKGKSKSITEVNNHIKGYYGSLWNVTDIDLESQIKKRLDLLEKCCQHSGICQIFDRGYNILYNKNNILTIEFNHTTFRAKDYSDYLSFNTKTGKKINSNIIIKDKRGYLLKEINSRLSNILIENEIESNPINKKFDLNNLNNIFIETLNQKDGIVLQYSYGLENEEFDPILSKKDLFFSFIELKPYLTEEFKKQLGIK